MKCTYLMALTTMFLTVASTVFGVKNRLVQQMARLTISGKLRGYYA